MSERASRKARRQQRTEYEREYRAKMSAEKKERQKGLMRARSRALTRLTGLHPEDFEMLYEDELTKEGIHDAEVRGMRQAGIGVADDQQGAEGVLGELQDDAEESSGGGSLKGPDFPDRSGEEG